MKIIIGILLGYAIAIVGLDTILKTGRLYAQIIEWRLQEDLKSPPRPTRLIEESKPEKEESDEKTI